MLDVCDELIHTLHLLFLLYILSCKICTNSFIEPLKHGDKTGINVIISAVIYYLTKIIKAESYFLLKH